MKSRFFICLLTLVAYSGNLMHSVLPHHHYASYNEYKDSSHGSHQEEGHDHEEEGANKSDDNHELPAGLFFLTHTSNIDFSLTKFSSQQGVKVKIQSSDVHVKDILLSDNNFAESLFQIPDSPFRVDDPTLSSRSLRAPPSII